MVIVAVVGLVQHTAERTAQRSPHHILEQQIAGNTGCNIACTCHWLQQQAQRRARAIAAQGGAAEAATVWTCVCGCEALSWEPCPGCGADVPQRAMQAAIAGVRPVLDAPPDGSAAAAHQAFRRGVLDGYAVGRSGLLKECPAAYRLCDPALMPVLPPPSAGVRMLSL